MFSLTAHQALTYIDRYNLIIALHQALMYIDKYSVIITFKSYHDCCILIRVPPRCRPLLCSDPPNNSTTLQFSQRIITWSLLTCATHSGPARPSPQPTPQAPCQSPPFDVLQPNFFIWSWRHLYFFHLEMRHISSGDYWNAYPQAYYKHWHTVPATLQGFALLSVGNFL